MTQTLTSGQKDAAHRRDVYGVVYALTGTLKSAVAGIPDATFYWATKPISSAGGPILYSGGWDQYITLPQAVEEELPLRPGEVPPLHSIPILVRNLPFRHSESVLTAITDGDWQWEGTTASLYAAFQRTDQSVSDVPTSDWFPVRVNGQLGGPQNIGSDGFTVPLVSREVVRRQQVSIREIVSGEFPNADPREYGKVLATVYGAPDSWIRARRTDAGIFGLTVDAVLSGTTDTLFVANSAGFNFQDLVGKQVYLYRGDKILTVDSIGGSDTTKPSVTFTTTINFNVPQGSVIQEKISSGYDFALLNQPGDFPLQVRNVAFETLDGRIVPLDVSTYQVRSISDTNAKGAIGTAHTNPKRTEIRILDTVQPPALIPRLNLPSETAEVVTEDLNLTQQPLFATSQKIEGTKSNYPTGPGFASAAFDGNENTGYSVPPSGGGPKNSVTFTFPSVPGGNFTNSDTIRSVLKFTSQGSFQVTDGGVTVFANTSGSKGSYTIVLGSPVNFNQQVRFIEQGSGGIVYEINWEHDLQADIDINRTQDVDGNINVEVQGTGEVGFDMVPIKALVAQVNAADSTADDFALPNHIFRDLQMRFLGETGSSFYKAASYTTAEARYDSEKISLHFVIDRQFTWPELEAAVALASRSYAFYGPEGHEIVFIEDAATQALVTPAAEFRLPGTPNPNATQSAGSPLMERTSLADLINTVRVYYGRNWLLPRSEDVEERFEGYAEESNSAALARFGRRIDAAGIIEAWPIARASNYVRTAPGWGVGGYSGDTHAAAIAQWLADRYALSQTRFAFDTAGEVVGVQRGDLVRVSFASSPGVYRNVLCEVEDVKIVPNSVNRYSLVCRSIATPKKGLTSALIWTDLFTSTSDTWTSRMTGVYDRWDQYFRAA